MKKLTLVVAAIFCFNSITAQQTEIQLETTYGSDNKEIHDLLRFQNIETIVMEFKGEQLKAKNYTILVKEFTNGSLYKTDTILNSKSSEYIPVIKDTLFKFKYFVKTQMDNKVKMTFLFNRFSVTKKYDIKVTEDQYALHDFLGGNKSIPIKLNTKKNILVYFLPYLEKETGWKKYCDVSGSKYQPEEWGNTFNIPSYFLVEVLFE
jgi:hypothetical protein